VTPTRTLRLATLMSLVAIALWPLPARAVPSEAALRLSKIVGPPTAPLVVYGKGFAPSETVDVTFDGHGLGSLVADQHGGFHHRARIPAWALPGTHRIDALGRESGRFASATYLVRTDWPQGHFDAQAHSNNPYENVLNPQNVGGLTERWSTFIAHQSLTWRVVMDGVLYLGVANEGVVAIDPKTGAILWSRPLPPFGVYLAMASGEGLVFAATSIGGDLYALDGATGDIVWRQPSASGFNGPTYAGGVVYAGNGDGHVYAIDASSGELLWKSHYNSGIITNPVVVGPTQVIAIGDDTQAFDRTDGHLLWVQDRTESIVPVLGNGLVFECQGDVAIAIDANDGSIVWENAHVPGSGGGGALSVADGRLFIPHYDGTLSVLDAQTGGFLWSAPLGELSLQTPTVANGVVYATNWPNLVALDAGTGTPLWRHRIGTSGIGQPIAVIVDGVVFASDIDGVLHAFSL
jgi:outer membrane protein assembly factor BamB